MKYCLFDGGDVVGPFTAQQLLLRPGFGAHSLVCPEEHSDEEAYWKEAHFYEEFGFSSQEMPARAVPEESENISQTAQFLKEMDTVMSELSSLPTAGKETVLPAAAPEQPAEKTKPTEKKEKDSSSSKKQTAAPAPAESVAQQSPASAPRQAASGEEQSLLAEHSQTHEKSKEKKEKAEAKISSLLLQASEEMKRRRVGREAVSKAEEQKKKSASALQTPVEQKMLDEEPDQVSVIAKEETAAADAQKSSAAPAGVESRTVSSLSPIEEYFNTIRSGDLGNILGIPDPKENSDMNLVRALESQFEKTDPGLHKPLEEDPFDEFTPKDKKAETTRELLTELTQKVDKETEENLRRSLPDLKEAESLPLAGQSSEQMPAEEDTIPPSVQEMLVPEQEDDPNDRTVKTILEGKLKVDTLRQEIPEPIKDVPAEERLPARPADQEEEQPRLIKHRPTGMMKFVFLGLGVMVLLAGAYLNWTFDDTSSSQAETEQTTAAAASASEEQPAPAEPVPDARQAIHAQPLQPVQDPLELAKEIVQNYPLDKNRGTIEEYLNRLYSKQLQSGYAAVWSAEPLHRDSYVVKYRLAKTRKEPIVYIFQVDASKKKLTGALNNITLDLVGKIR